MTYQHAQARREPKSLSDPAERWRLFGWSAFGLGAFAAVMILSVGGLYLIYLIAIGDVFSTLYCELQLSFFCPRPVWATVVMIAAGIVFALWLFAALLVLLTGIDPPDGIVVSAEDVPELFALIERVAGSRGAAALDAVVIDADCNAGMSVCPTFGVLGPLKTRLVIGLPLLDALDEQELPALLGHELAHLSDHAGVLEDAAHRAFAIWQRVWLYCCEGGLPGAPLLTRFSMWYLDELNTVRLRHSRQQELEADAAAAAGQGTDVSVTAILRIAVASLWFERMWELLPHRIRRHGKPRFRPFDVAPRWFRRLYQKDRFERLMRVALVQATSHRDTHPAWHERIAALRTDPQVPPPVRIPASRILGAFETKLRRDMHNIWVKQISYLWRDEHEDAKSSEQQLAELEREAADGRIEPEDARMMAHLTRYLRGAAHAAPLYRAIVEQDPEDAEMRYSLGEALLDLSDGEGLAHLDKARALDAGLSAGVIALASDFLTSNGDMARARAYCIEIDGALDEFERAGDERSTITQDDVLDPHALDRAAIAQIADCVAGIPGVRRAWLARKRVERLRARPCLVLVVDYTTRKRVLGTAESEHQKLLDACAELPFDMFCLRNTYADRRFQEKIKAVSGSDLFDRELPPLPAARKPA